LEIIRQNSGATHPHPPPSVRDHSLPTRESGHETGDGGGWKEMGGVVGSSKLGEIQNNRTRNKKRQVEGAEG